MTTVNAVRDDALYASIRRRVVLQSWCTRADLMRVYHLDGYRARLMIDRLIEEGIAVPTSNPDSPAVVSTILHRL
jgi:hypothetical protein